jgi:hypothetical protein
VCVVFTVFVGGRGTGVGGGGGASGTGRGAGGDGPADRWRVGGRGARCRGSAAAGGAAQGRGGRRGTTPDQSYIRDNTGRLIAIREGTARRYVHADALGSSARSPTNPATSPSPTATTPTAAPPKPAPPARSPTPGGSPAPTTTPPSPCTRWGSATWPRMQPHQQHRPQRRTWRLRVWGTGGKSRQRNASHCLVWPQWAYRRCGPAPSPTSPRLLLSLCRRYPQPGAVYMIGLRYEYRGSE